MKSTVHTQRTRLATLLAFALVVLSSLVGPRSANAQVAGLPPELQHVGVTEHLDGQLPLATPFRDHTGAPVTLGKYFDGKRPVVLQFAYHTCPVVCSMITANLAVGLKGVPWTIGKEYDVVTISIDPRESLEKTAAKRTSILNEYGRQATKETGGWHFLVGDEASIKAVTNAAGFEYQYDARQQQWGHPSVVFVIKPNGRVARYLYGLEFPSEDLRLGLLEASEGRHITTVEQIILYCYHYDPQGGKYVVVGMRIMQVAGGAVALALMFFLGGFWLRELTKKNGPTRDGTPGSGGGDTTNQIDDGSSLCEALDPTDVLSPPSRGEPISVRGG